MVILPLRDLLTVNEARRQFSFVYRGASARLFVINASLNTAFPRPAFHLGVIDYDSRLAPK